MHPAVALFRQIRGDAAVEAGTACILESGKKWECAGKAGEVQWMKEPYDQGVASQVGPESCGCVRKGVVEALTGVRTGWVLSPVNSTSGMPRRFPTSEGNTKSLDKRERPGPAGSEAPGTYGSTSRGRQPLPDGSREIPGAARAVSAGPAS
jgi:hypothetical protein